MRIHCNQKKAGSLFKRWSSVLFSSFLIVLMGLFMISCPMVKDAATTKQGNVDAANERDSYVDEFDNQDEIESLRQSTSDDGGVDVEDSDLKDKGRLGKIVSLDAEPFEFFFESILKTQIDGKGLVRVLHYGDSHTAADFLTTAIRRSLQKRFGDGGRGFVLLGKPWKSYRPNDVALSSSKNWKTERITVSGDRSKMDGYYGLGGVTVASGGRNAFSKIATVNGAYGKKASSFEIFYLTQPRGGSFRVLVDGKVKGTISTSSKKLRTGFFKVATNEGYHEFEIKLRGDGQVRFFGGVIENEGPGIVYDTLGINGGFFYTPLRWNAEELKKQVERRNPSLIVTMYGSNEADSRTINPLNYKNKVLKTMERFRAGAPSASCLMLGPPDRIEKTVRKGQLAWIIDVQREVASEIGCAFFDVRELMGGEGSHKRWQHYSPPFAQADGIHLSVKGYRILGEQIAAQILTKYEEYAKK